jgi:hypothetical protein
LSFRGACGKHIDPSIKSWELGKGSLPTTGKLGIDATIPEGVPNLPPWPPLTIRQSAARYWMERSERLGAGIGAASGGALGIIGNAEGAP